MRKKRWLLALCFVFSGLGFFSCRDRLFDNPFDPDRELTAYELVATISIPGISPLDLAFSGDSLWVVDTASRIISLNYNSGAVIRQLDFYQLVNGICYDGDGLWVSRRGQSQIIKIDIVNGSVIRVLNLVRGDLAGMDFFDDRLYIIDRQTNSVLVVSPETGAIDQSITCPGFSLNGVAFDGVHLWTIDSNQQRIYRLTESGTVVGTYQAPSPTVVGLCFNSGIIWCGDQTGKIYQLKFQ